MAQPSFLDDTSGQPLKGVGDGRPDIPPLAHAVVIGIGGSGIQTISRVKASIDGVQPEAVAIPAVTFLGIDAVVRDKQYPSLPPGVNLNDSEYYNLTATPFDAAALVRLESYSASPLQDWFDFDQEVPRGPLTEGLKQNRPLGRLAYYRAGSELVHRITQAIIKSAAIQPGRNVAGAAGVRPRVFIVSSTCGGTGSSGLLDVIHKVWAATNSLGLSPDIRLFLFGPGLFESEVSRASANPAIEIENLRANTYGFLTELDHFINHADQLDSAVAYPDPYQQTNIPRGDLVQQVFLIDRQLTQGGFLTSVKDAYEIAGAAIYQLIMTAVGQQVAVNGVNVDTLLREYDDFSKRRIYCGLGLSCITYPGETLRRHLGYHFADWLIWARLLHSPEDLSERVRQHENTNLVVQRIGALRDELATSERDPDVRSFEQDCARAAEILATDNDPESVARYLAMLRNQIPTVQSILDDQMAAKRDATVAKVVPIVMESVRDTGQGIPFGIDMLKYLQRKVRDMVRLAEQRESHYQNLATQGQVAMEEAERDLQGAQWWQLWSGGRQRPARVLGEAAATHGLSLIRHQVAATQRSFLVSARSLIDNLRAQLERAERALQDESVRLAAGWHADDLVGKDAGPVALTTLIPGDAQPEVEDSALARAAFAELLQAVQAVNEIDLLRDFYAQWAKTTNNRGPFGLGFADEDTASSARKALLAELQKLADKYALQRGHAGTAAGVPDGDQDRLILPRTLKDAADRVDGGAALDAALMNASGHAGQVLLPVNFTLLPAHRSPSPASIISRPTSLRDKVERYLPQQIGRQVADWPDEERIQVFTTMWGASAHSLSAIPTWKDAYERAVRHAAKDPNIRRPHLDRRWATELIPLQPSYFDDQLAAKEVVLALLVTRLLADEATHARIFGANPLREDLGVPLRAEDRMDQVRWRAQTFTYDLNDERWVRAAQEFDFGATWAHLLKAVGENAGFRQRNSLLAATVLAAVGRPAVIEALEDLKATRLDPLVAEQVLEPEEHRARELVQREAASFLANLRSVQMTVPRV